MYELKTKETDQSVEDFLNQIEKEKKRSDSFAILELMKKASKKEPRMWGGAIIGFGHRPYVYPDGREMAWFYIGFSPRKQNFSLYLPHDFDEYEDLIQKFGKIKTSKACIYFNKLEDVDQAVFKELVKKSISYLDKKKAR